MTELGPVLSRMGLEQYLENFIEEGFDSWEVVLDITESDLDALGVRLGHRRKLQREIANARGYDVDRLPTSPTRSLENGGGQGLDEKVYAGKETGKSHGIISGKRKYRRHPKPDENAPERPPSAYVIFSNKIREELRPQNLTFTEIAKRVGERWQILLPEAKEPYELQASTAKEKYYAELINYKKTDEYKEYSKYLADFKAKNTSLSDGKRPRLEKEASVASSGSTGSQVELVEAPSSGTLPSRGYDPLGSMGPYSLSNEHQSPGSVAVTMAPPNSFGTHSSTLGPGSSDTISPTTILRGETAILSTLQTSSKIHLTNEHIFDINFETTKGPTLPRIVPLESRDSRVSLSNNHSFLNDSKILRSRNSPPQNFRPSNRPSAALLRHSPSMSSNSSSMSSNSITTPGSVYTPMTPMTPIEDTRSQRSLPPLSTAGVKYTGGSSYVDSSGQPNHNSLSNQPSSYVLPVPQNSPFTSSSSSTGISSEPGLSRRSLSREAQEKPQPQSRPFLPNPGQVASDRDQRLTTEDDDPAEHFPTSQADPLSVLAYAGRIVDRGGR